VERLIDGMDRLGGGVSRRGWRVDRRAACVPESRIFALSSTEWWGRGGPVLVLLAILVLVVGCGLLLRVSASILLRCK
jgi:hypothetical protein